MHLVESCYKDERTEEEPLIGSFLERPGFVQYGIDVVVLHELLFHSAWQQLIPALPCQCNTQAGKWLLKEQCTLQRSL